MIHRDIKAANILTTKEGYIKLADFGVATETKRTSENDDSADPVAGSPYWSTSLFNHVGTNSDLSCLCFFLLVAPEIIEMNGATTKSDIWSCGCTIIELLTGKPPYFDLEMMAALFRIVQDDCPPLPDDVSPPLRDFLMQCFQKEPMLRQSADKLLKHRWIAAAVKRTAESGAQPSATPVKAIEEHNAKRKAAFASPTKLPEPSSSRKDKLKSSSRSGSSKTRHGSEKRPSSSRKEERSDSGRSTTRPSKTARDDDDNWDDDFADPTPATKKTSPHDPAKQKAATLRPAKVSNFAEDEDEDWDADVRSQLLLASTLLTT